MRGSRAGFKKETNPADQICGDNPRPGGCAEPKPGGCLFPEPEVHYRLAPLWHAFTLWKLTLTFSRMDGGPENPYDALRLQQLILLCGEVWDTFAFETLIEWISGYLDRLPRPSSK